MAKFFSLGNKIVSTGNELNYGTDSDGKCCCKEEGEEGDTQPTFMPNWTVSAYLGAGSFKFKMPIRAKKDGKYYGNKFRGWLKCSFSREGSKWASKIELPEGGQKTAYKTQPLENRMWTDEELEIPEGEPGHVEEWAWGGTYWSESMGTPDFCYRETIGFLDSGTPDGGESDEGWSACKDQWGADSGGKYDAGGLGYYFKTAPEGCGVSDGEGPGDDAYCSHGSVESLCERFLAEDPMGVKDCFL